MSRIDRYMLSQLLVHFAFFALVLIAVFWINRAVGLFDRLIGDGQTAMVFLEFTVLGLPKLIATVMPIAAFAGSVYVTHRMNNDSELTVMLATGTGPWRLVRPVLIYGACAGLMMATLTHVLLPLAEERLNQREVEISQNITSRLLSEGAFLNPADNTTFYTQSIDDEGVLTNVFLSDRRDAERPVTYTAQQAYLVREGEEYSLVMVDGLAQQYSPETKRLSTTTFKDYSFNISALINSGEDPRASVRYMMSWELAQDWEALAERIDFNVGSIAEELHSRIAQPLFCVMAALVGFSTLLVGGFSRFGVWREIVLAFVLLLVIDGLRGALIDQVLRDPRNWPLLYIPTLLGGVLAALTLWIASRPSLLRRRVSAGTSQEAAE